MSNRDNARTDVLQGTLDLMVLQTVQTLGPQHGYAIAARLEQVSAGALQLNMGTLYPALMRLEQRGLLRGEWGTTDANRKARFYGLTAAGRRELARERQAWDRMAGIMRDAAAGRGPGAMNAGAPRAAGVDSPTDGHPAPAQARCRSRGGTETAPRARHRRRTSAVASIGRRHSGRRG